MVAGWPIAHHVWAGNEVDHTTVGKAIADLHRRFGFNRLVFVGDRGLVTSDNLDAITAGNHGYLVGLKRRRNKKLDRWLAAVDEAKWINCPVGITAREKADPPRTRAQEVPSGIAGMRVIIVDSDERRAYEEAMRVKSMERTRQALEKLRLRIAAGKLKQPEKIGAAAERLLQRSHGYRYYSWEIHQGGFRYFENAAGLGSEKGIEGKYVIATSELGLSVLEVVAIYKDLSDVERGFRQLKDVLAMRPIYHQIEARVKAHIFVAALALLVQRLLDRRLEEAGINFSAERAMEALQTVRLVTFRMDDRPERRGVSGGCPDAAPGPEGIEADGSEAADTPRGGGNRDVVTIRKIESCPPRGYVDGPQTWASGFMWTSVVPYHYTCYQNRPQVVSWWTTCKPRYTYATLARTGRPNARGIAAALVAMPWRAVLGACNFAVVLAGGSGGGKTSLGCLVTQHFAPDTPTTRYPRHRSLGKRPSPTSSGSPTPPKTLSCASTTSSRTQPKPGPASKGRDHLE